MKTTLKHKIIIVIAFITIAITNSYMLYAQNSCTQNNIVATNYQLRNSSGQPFSVTDDYELGDPVTGELWVTLTNNTGGGYNLRMFYDLYRNNNISATDQQDCLFEATEILANTWVRVRPISWNWGDVIEVKNIFIDWTTGTVKSGTTCDFAAVKKTSQCYSSPTGFTAAVPLFPKFDFADNGICNTTIQFTSETIGGSPPYNYTYQWDFGGLGTATGANPVFNFPGSGVYTIGMTANDGVSTTTIQKDIFIDPNFGITVDIFPTKKDESSGMIYTTVGGGTEPYTYSWTGPDGYNSTSKDIFNLSDGTYNLLVTDSNGCQQTEEYTLDIASILGFNLAKFQVLAEKSKILINWEVTSETENSVYEIERSNGNAKAFSTIGTVRGNGAKSTLTNYLFIDQSYPFYENRFYYRIAKTSSLGVSYSPVKMVEKQDFLESQNSWQVYPNPCSECKIILTTIENENPSNVRLELLNSYQLLEAKDLILDDSGVIDLNAVFGSIPKGLSILKIEWGTKIETLKLIGAN
ncbi:PKD domain-containing protein [Algoriphagus yeomjeoni]|uniref:PKD domain-containing protein n=1 Tax=Algoriphagus yeomjeoni TaxID=291403 RepID=UPI003CE58474